ncbi:MAG TPA: lysophospholipid acyltransferase family protein [Candidatus Manganitrophaceae bacterium]|nr:lysophospholipid acyltransferase family protein [Candidatus Manganitrophaceae bacterium]
MRQSPGLFTNFWHAVGLSFWYLIFKGFNRIKVYGREHIPARGERGVMFLYNHISAIDPFSLAVTSMPFFSPVWWRAPAKEELFKIPVVRSVISTWGAFPVQRGKRDLAAIERMVEMLKNSVVVIAPEGTRSPDGALRRGKAGVGKIIYDARPRKIIPTRIRGVDRILPKGSVFPRIGKQASVTYGAPLDLSPYYSLPESVETSQKIVDAVMEAISKL